MERIILACGGKAVNHTDDLCAEEVGAMRFMNRNSGQEKYTLLEGVKNPKSCTILIKGPNSL